MALSWMPAKDGQNELIIGKSQFICHVFRVSTVAEAKRYIEQIQAKHAKANHNCIAYQIGDNGEIARAIDDGEPSGTAGVPMLDVLKHQGITNCLLIVTRYFGGVKLGAGGLIRAYSTSASEGIKAVGLVARIHSQQLRISTTYPLAKIIEHKCKGRWEIMNTQYGATVEIDINVPVNEINEFTTSISEWTNNHVSFLD